VNQEGRPIVAEFLHRNTSAFRKTASACNPAQALSCEAHYSQPSRRSAPVARTGDRDGTWCDHTGSEWWNPKPYYFERKTNRKNRPSLVKARNISALGGHNAALGIWFLFGDNVDRHTIQLNAFA
jgi:hypothetical protein